MQPSLFYGYQRDGRKQITHDYGDAVPQLLANYWQIIGKLLANFLIL